jgi:hypothetical protein
VGRPNKIRSAGLEGEVRKLAAQGLTSRQIADQLLKRKGVQIGHVAVARFMAEETSDRRDAARNVAMAEAKETVPLALKVLKQATTLTHNLMNREYRGSGTQDQPSTRVREFILAARAATVAARALHQVTMGEGGEGTASAALSEVQRILAEKRKAEADGTE